MIGLCMFEQWNTRLIRIIHEHHVLCSRYLLNEVRLQEACHGDCTQFIHDTNVSDTFSTNQCIHYVFAKRNIYTRM